MSQYPWFEQKKVYKSFGQYYSYRKNPDLYNSHDWTNKIILLKECNKRAIREIYNIINKLIPSSITLAVVPSSDPKKEEYGIGLLAAKLVKSRSRYDATDCLIRRYKVRKQSMSGIRLPRGRQAKSISIQKTRKIKGKDILLLDDVRTTGVSLEVCEAKLLKAGARSVKRVCLAQTV